MKFSELKELNQCKGCKKHFISKEKFYTYCYSCYLDYLETRCWFPTTDATYHHNMWDDLFFNEEF